MESLLLIGAVIYFIFDFIGADTALIAHLYFIAWIVVKAVTG